MRMTAEQFFRLILGPFRASVLLWCSGSLALFAQDPAYRQFTTADGLPSQTVYCATQDKEGYMWFGTDAGASRFDGSTFTTFNTSDGLGDNEVLGIFSDSRGRVWFMALNGQVSFYEKGKIHNASTNPYIGLLGSSLGTLRCGEDPAGSVYFSSIGGQVTRLSGDQVEIFQVTCEVGDENGLPTILCTLEHGLLIVHGSNIHRPTGSGFQLVRKWESRNLAATGILGGKAIGLGMHGVEHLLTGRSLIDPILDADEVRSLWSQRDTTLWLAYRGGGVLRVPSNRSRIDRLFEGIVFGTAYEDLYKNLWFCTLGQGVILSTEEQLGMRVYHPQPDVIGNSPGTISLTRDECWLGTDQGGVYRLVNDCLETVVSATPRQRERVRAILKYQPTRVIYTSDRSTWRLTQRARNWDREKVSAHTPGGPFIALKTLALDRSGAVMGSGQGLVALFDSPTEPFLVAQKKWSSIAARTYCLLTDSVGRIWFETAQRLHCLENGKPHDFPTLDSLFGARITSLAILDREHVVVASAGGGVSILREGDLVRRFTVKEGLCSDQCRKVMVHNGVLFIGTTAGITRIEDPLAEPRMRTWTTNEGLPANDVLDLTATDTSMLVVLSSGLCVLPLRPPVSKRSPPLVFHSVMLDRIQQTPSHVHHIVWGRSLLSVTLQALAFAGREELGYAYRTSSDPAWVRTVDPVINFTDLPVGEQRIEFRAERPGSEPGPVLVLLVRVTMPWYATLWAKITAGLGMLSIGLLLAYTFSRRKLRAQRGIWDREQAIAHERQRIAADMHDDLGAEISSLMMSARSLGVDGEPTEGLAALAQVVEDRTRTLMVKIDEIIWWLDPESDTLLPTITFIQRYAEEFAVLNNLGFRAQVNGIDGARPIKASIRRDLYLTIKEALRNVGQHAHATTIQLIVDATPSHIRFIIEDNGTGVLQTRVNRTGHGSSNMRERVARMGGQLTIRPSATGGTQVVIDLQRFSE
jgi:signal transduction histidine kinase